MDAAGLSQAAKDAFKHNYEQLVGHLLPAVGGGWASCMSG